jgi:hypothetical protein
MIGVKSRWRVNPFSLGALVIAVLVWSDVFHLSFVQIVVATIPGTVLGGIGVLKAFKKGQRMWIAWTAFGLNFGPTLLGFVLGVAYLLGLRPSA